MKFCQMWVCWHLLFCVCIGCWLVGFLFVFMMARKTFISFSPSPFLCNLLVSSPGYVSCLSFMLCLKISGLVLFVSFSPPCQCRVSPTSPGRAFCLLPAQASKKLAACSTGFFICGVPPPLHPSLHPRSMSLNSRTTVPSKIFLSGLLPPSHSIVCPWVHQAGVATGRVGM